MADTFIKFDGIPGESTSNDHPGEIEVLSWNWGLTAAQPPAGGGGGTSRATPHALAFTHFYDKASPVRILYSRIQRRGPVTSTSIKARTVCLRAARRPP